VSTALVTAVGTWLNRRPSRREFLVRSALIGSALVVHPIRYLLRPGTAYELIANLTLTRECPPGALCYADAYTEFCCTINDGVNECPAGTIAGGWWKADGSIYCAGPRYYIDCVGLCTNCSTGCSSGFCPDCDEVPPCDCANGDCGNRRVGCKTFRYGQCHQDVGCVGRLSCRVVSCTPAWLLDPACTTTSATDNRTANHSAPCLQEQATDPTTPVVAIAAAQDGRGYWLASADGGVFSYGTAAFLGAAADHPLNAPVVGFATDPDAGYWLASADGGVFSFGVPFAGSAGGQHLNRAVVDMAATPDGAGYWLAAGDGGVFAFGTAGWFGSTGGSRLNSPIVAMAAAPDGLGYWLVAGDGGVFAFGSAGWFGSLGDQRLNRPIVAMAPTHDGLGYWLVAADGGVFAFGTADWYGSLGDIRLARPIVGIAATPDGRGYWLAAEDGGVFSFGSARFYGSGVRP
jgi:hypothetical protein